MEASRLTSLLRLKIRIEMIRTQDLLGLSCKIRTLSAQGMAYS